MREKSYCWLLAPLYGFLWVLSTAKYETNTYEVSDAFDGISIDTDTADIVFAFSDNGKCRVECHEEEKAKNSVTVEEGTLTIKLLYERAGYFVQKRYLKRKHR